MKKFLGFIVAACLLAPFPTQALDTPVASIKTVGGSSSIIRDKAPVQTIKGSKVFRGDLLKTGADGSMAIIFRDDTLLSLGPNSEIALTEFLFSPAEGKLSFIAKLLRGTAACVTGIIGKLSPESVRFETPVANIGIRGTKFAVMIEKPND
ncbi:MAG: FecR domain-containing protein [Geobacteraceae bacterium]